MADQTREHLENRARHPRIPVPHARRGDLVVDLPTEILARFLHALADPTRLRILEHLSRDGELHVSALVERLGQPQGRVSAHLTCLRTCGLVRVRQDGKYRYYAVADQRIPALLALARELARPNAAAIASCAIGTRHDPPEETVR